MVTREDLRRWALSASKTTYLGTSAWAKGVTAETKNTSRACWYSDSLALESPWLFEELLACFSVTYVIPPEVCLWDGGEVQSRSVGIRHSSIHSDDGPMLEEPDRALA